MEYVLEYVTLFTARCTTESVFISFQIRIKVPVIFHPPDKKKNFPPFQSAPILYLNYSTNVDFSVRTKKFSCYQYKKSLYMPNIPQNFLVPQGYIADFVECPVEYSTLAVSNYSTSWLPWYGTWNRMRFSFLFLLIVLCFIKTVTTYQPQHHSKIYNE